MKFPKRISNCPTVPDLIRAAADERTARWARMLPAEVWCRPSAFVALFGRDPCHASGIDWSWRAGSLPSPCMEAASPTLGMGAYFFTGARLVLATSHLLLRAGPITPADAAVSLNWSVRLTQAGMHRWRRLRDASGGNHSHICRRRPTRRCLKG